MTTLTAVLATVLLVLAVIGWALLPTLTHTLERIAAVAP